MKCLKSDTAHRCAGTQILNHSLIGSDPVKQEICIDATAEYKRFQVLVDRTRYRRAYCSTEGDACRYDQCVRGNEVRCTISNCCFGNVFLGIIWL